MPVSTVCKKAKRQKDHLNQGFSTGGPRPPGGPRRHCRGSVTWAYVDQFTIDFLNFYKYTWARRHIYVNLNSLNSQVALPKILM